MGLADPLVILRFLLVVQTYYGIPEGTAVPSNTFVIKWHQTQKENKYVLLLCSKSADGGPELFGPVAGSINKY